MGFSETYCQPVTASNGDRQPSSMTLPKTREGLEGLPKVGALKKLTPGLQWVGSASEGIDGSQLGSAQQAADEATPQGGALADHRTSQSG